MTWLRKTNTGRDSTWKGGCEGKFRCIREDARVMLKRGIYLGWPIWS